jgi:hypothetical protein
MQAFGFEFRIFVADRAIVRVIELSGEPAGTFTHDGVR